MTPGRVIAVVGPSGVGKDSVIDGLCAAQPGLVRIRRSITRPAEPDGEDHDEVSLEMFEKCKNDGDFVLSWGAHGLFYGIAQSEMSMLSKGQDAIVNLSRGVLTKAADQFANLTVLHLTARSTTLAERLRGRGRENADQIGGRLAQADKPLPPGLDVVTIANDGPLADTVATALAALYPDRG